MPRKKKLLRHLSNIASQGYKSKSKTVYAPSETSTGPSNVAPPKQTCVANAPASALSDPNRLLAAIVSTVSSAITRSTGPSNAPSPEQNCPTNLPMIALTDASHLPAAAASMESASFPICNSSSGIHPDATRPTTSSTGITAVATGLSSSMVSLQNNYKSSAGTANAAHVTYHSRDISNVSNQIMSSTSESSAEGAHQEDFMKDVEEEAGCAPELVLVKEERDTEECEALINLEKWFCNIPEMVEDVKVLGRSEADPSGGSSVSALRQTACSSVLEGDSLGFDLGNDQIMSSPTKSSAEEASHKVIMEEEEEEVVCDPDLVLIKEEEEDNEESQALINQESWFLNEAETLEDFKVLGKTGAVSSNISSVSALRQTACSSVITQEDFKDGSTGLKSMDSDQPSIPSFCDSRTTSDVLLRTHFLEQQSAREDAFVGNQSKDSSDRKSDFQEHLYTHKNDKDKPFACNQCSYTTNRSYQLKYHLRRHESARHKPLACTQCEYRTDLKKSLKLHLRTHESVREKPFACNQCKYRTDIISKLKRHLRIHDSARERPFACHLCNHTTFTKQNLSIHLLAHEKHRDKPSAFNQRNCSTYYEGSLGISDAGSSYDSSVFSLRQSPCSSVLGGEGESLVKAQGDFEDGSIGSKSNDSDQPSIHSFCNNTTTSDGVLKTHFIEQQSTREDAFDSNQSKDSIDGKSDPIEHLYTYNGGEDKPFACNQCSYTTDRKFQLKQHLRTHETVREKPFACTQCEYRTDIKNALKLHLRTHESVREKPFACNQCKYRTDIISQLKRHLRTHESTREKPFACHLCNHTTYNKQNLKLHLLTHEKHRDKPLACNQCNYSTHHKGTLQKHLRTHEKV